MQALLLVCLLYAASVGAQAAASNLIRVSLSKTTNPRGGHLGQPLTSYYVKTDIGTPAKQFRLVVDLNSRENWLPHHLTLGAIYPRLHYKKGYAKKSSSTGEKEENKEYTIEYNTCQLTGKAYKDYFEFKNVVESLKAPKFKQRFLAISSASNSKFADRGEVDGVVSLNPWTISETSSDLVLTSLSKANLVNELKFGLALDDRQTLSEEPETGGELTFGGYNPSYFLGALRYHQIWSPHEWLVKLQSVMLGSREVSCANSCEGVISTSDNDLYGPAKDVQQILIMLGFGEEIKRDGFKTDKLYEIDCLQVAQAPPLTFVIEGSYYKITAASYIRKKFDGIIFKSQTCYVALLANQASTNGNDRWILGTNFLANFYSVFDVNSRRVAFGARK